MNDLDFVWLGRFKCVPFSVVLLLVVRLVSVVSVVSVVPVGRFSVVLRVRWFQ
jgi:hypothetical protein